MPPAWRGKTLSAYTQLIHSPASQGQGIVWVDDSVEVAFLQIQDSGQAQLEEGDIIRLGADSTNNQLLHSLTRWLLDMSEITPVQVTI